MNLQKFNRIIFIPTFRCQNKCSYCDYNWEIIKDNKSYSVDAFGHKWQFDIELHWAYWLAAFSRLRPYHLSLTGGEPTLWPGLVEFIEHIPRSCSWDITSNTLEQYVVDNIMPANIRTWTASYHYNKTELFLENLKILRQRGIPVAVTLVLSATNIEKVKDAVKIFNEKKLRCSIHPMLQQGFDWKDHKAVFLEMQDFLKQENEKCTINFGGSGMNKIVNDIPKAFIPQGPVKSCPAGKNYFFAFPDGRTYRCYSHAMSENLEPMGEIGEFKQNENDEPCPGGCLFPCDIQCQRNEHLDI